MRLSLLVKLKYIRRNVGFNISDHWRDGSTSTVTHSTSTINSYKPFIKFNE